MCETRIRAASTYAGVMASLLGKDWSPTEYLSHSLDTEMSIINSIISGGGVSVETPAAELRNGYREGSSALKTMSRDNEAASSNLPRRLVADEARLKTRRKKIRIATWNVRTLHKSGKIDNVKKEMERMKVDILGLSEVRWTGDGKINEDNKIIVYSGGAKHEQEVGVMMTKQVGEAMMGSWPVSDRIIMVKIKAAPFNINLIQVYAPTSSHSDEEIEEFYRMSFILKEFYQCIEEVWRYAKNDDVNILMGDFNAKVGRESDYPTTGKYGLGERNERGRTLIELCKGKSLIVTNTMFKHQLRNIYTWKSPGDIVRNQIDYIMINERFKNAVTNVKTYPGADVGSDHNPVLMQIKIKLKKMRKQKSHVKLELQQLKNQEKRQEYNVKVKNRFELLNVEEFLQVEENWQGIKSALCDSLNSTIPKRVRNKKKSWMPDEILQLMELRREAKNKPIEYAQLEKDINSKCKKAKEEWRQSKCNEIEQLEALDRH